MTVLVCGGRDYDDYDLVASALSTLRITRLVEGGATGADALARRWRKAHGIAGKSYQPEWKRYGVAAGPKRNQTMLDAESPKLVVAFPGGAGTADMIIRARAAGIEVWKVR